MRNCKFFLIVAATCVLASLSFSCKSSPKKADKKAAEKAAVEKSEDSENQTASDQTAEEVNTDSEKVENTENPENSDNSEKSEASENGEATVTAEAADASTATATATASDKEENKNAEPAEQNYTGWIKAASKNISETFGIVHLRVKSKFGAFTIGVKNDRGKTVPVLSTANEFVSNAFYLRNSRKIYALGTDLTAKTAAQKRNDGAAILYSVPSVADVLVEFKCFSSEEKVSMDMVKVTATITNRSTRIDDFSLKSVLDTVLGESNTFHFYNWEGVPVRNEVMYRTFQNQKWFVSKNNYAAMQFFYTGADCTEPELVALANRSTLEKNSWEPDMLSYRAFDTVLSYNDSAVCAIWKPMTLEPGKSGRYVFYMAFSVDGANLKGDKYIYPVEETVEKETPVLTSVEKISDASVSMPYTTITAEEELVKTPEQSEIKAVPSVDFYIKNMTKEHLTPEYIQSLLDRIAALEEDSPSLNRQELLQLNAELDAILTYLRQ